MVSLNAGESGLVLPQLNVPDFVDFPWEPLPDGRSRMGIGWGEGRLGTWLEEGWGELWMECKMNSFKKSNLKKTDT